MGNRSRFQIIVGQGRKICPECGYTNSSRTNWNNIVTIYQRLGYVQVYSVLKLVAVRANPPYIDVVEPRRIVVLASTDGLQGLSLGALNRERTVIPHSETASEAWKDYHTFILF